MFFEMFYRSDDALAINFAKTFEFNYINLRGYTISIIKKIINAKSSLSIEGNSLREWYHYDALHQKFIRIREPHVELYISGAHTQGIKHDTLSKKWANVAY